ncbi:MAG: hypothetical protein KatS3mg110_0037 [Pirellulaceae bacterium]|nr:MAG: hypothetical protein KatS3mg110_0037 [Pirellulaceae bacterium]
MRRLITSIQKACLLVLAVCFPMAGGCHRAEGDSSANRAPALSVAAASSNNLTATSRASRTAIRSGELPPSPADGTLLVEVRTNLGSFTIRLFAEKAPRTVENFLENYVERGFYEQTVFHHVERDFMIVAGGYTQDLKPKPTRAWIRNESDNGLTNRRGTVAMVRHPDYPHSATSQFFINVVDNPSLDYRPSASSDRPEEAYGYTVFGEVVSGMDVVDRIAAVPTRARGEFPAVPVEPVVIESIRRIDRAGSRP